MRFPVYIAEFLATFQLVLIGTGSVVYAQETHRIGNLEIAISFGLSVYIGVMLFSRVTGAHLNSSVTVYAFLMKEIKLKKAVYLILTQIIAATAASAVIHQFASPGSNLGSPGTNVSLFATWLIDCFSTCFLLITIFLVYKKSYIVLAIGGGGIVFLITWLTFPYTGAYINPARTLGPAIVSGNFTDLWVYLSAQISAAIFSFLAVRKRIRN